MSAASLAAPPAASREPLDLLVVGAGPTGIALGAEAVRRDLRVLVVDRGALTASVLDFPTDMIFFTTRDKLEIVDVPFTIADDKPTRRQALRYYRAVVDRYAVPLALHEEVTAVRPAGGRDGGFTVDSIGRRGAHRRHARYVVLATGYFDQPRHLGVPGEDRPWVHHRYREPYPHHGEEVLIVGGGNSAAEAALDLWRNGARVTLVHRGPRLKPTVKYWLEPDVRNRIEEGAVRACFDTLVLEFEDAAVAVRGPQGEHSIPADSVFVLVGYDPDPSLARGAGVRVDPHTLVPEVDATTCESNVPGLFIAGTGLAGRDTGRIFIESSREHATRIAEVVRARVDPLRR